MTNIAKARAVIAEACAAGVREFCVCSGSRNAPLLAVLAKVEQKLWTFVDERSAAFFALGRMKLLGEPVAVVTTSGTAAAELLPALVAIRNLQFTRDSIRVGSGAGLLPESRLEREFDELRQKREQVKALFGVAAESRVAVEA